jgi:hypothetical protein
MRKIEIKTRSGCELFVHASKYNTIKETVVKKAYLAGTDLAGADLGELYNTPFEVGKLFKTDWIRFVKPKKLSEYKMLIGHWIFSYSATGDTKNLLD